MDGYTRQTWSRPQLIVIARSGPEEAVLTACKTPLAPGSSTAYHATLCKVLLAGSCQRCSTRTGS
jgi:hypothetical protein